MFLYAVVNFVFGLENCPNDELACDQKNIAADTYEKKSNIEIRHVIWDWFLRSGIYRQGQNRQPPPREIALYLLRPGQRTLTDPRSK
jgi:hypothetical protein